MYSLFRAAGEFSVAVFIHFWGTRQNEKIGREGSGRGGKKLNLFPRALKDPLSPGWSAILKKKVFFTDRTRCRKLDPSWVINFSQFHAERVLALFFMNPPPVLWDWAVLTLHRVLLNMRKNTSWAIRLADAARDSAIYILYDCFGWYVPKFVHPIDLEYLVLRSFRLYIGRGNIP